jgi:hypothetical protein
MGRDLNPGRPRIRSVSANHSAVALDLRFSQRGTVEIRQNREDEGGTILRNVGNHLQGYTGSQSIRTQPILTVSSFIIID